MLTIEQILKRKTSIEDCNPESLKRTMLGVLVYFSRKELDLSKISDFFTFDGVIDFYTDLYHTQKVYGGDIELVTSNVLSLLTMDDIDLEEKQHMIDKYIQETKNVATSYKPSDIIDELLNIESDSDRLDYKEYLLCIRETLCSKGLVRGI